MVIVQFRRQHKQGRTQEKPVIRIKSEKLVESKTSNEFFPLLFPIFRLFSARKYPCEFVISLHAAPFFFFEDLNVLYNVVQPNCPNAAMVGGSG